MKQDQKQTLGAALLVACLMVGTSSAGLVEKLTTFMWNYFVYYNAVQATLGCWYMGGWSLFWDNDDGAGIQMCMEWFGGASVTFPVEYTLN